MLLGQHAAQSDWKMKEPATVEFRGGGSYLRFVLPSRTSPGDPPYPGEPEFIGTSVTVQTPDFRGGFATTTWLGEWQHLRRRLADLDRCRGQDAEINGGFTEAGIDLTFALARRGYLVLHVEIIR